MAGLISHSFTVPKASTACHDCHHLYGDGDGDEKGMDITDMPVASVLSRTLEAYSCCKMARMIPLYTQTQYTCFSSDPR